MSLTNLKLNKKTLTGWGNYPQCNSLVASPSTLDELKTLAKEKGSFVAVSDYMKIVPDQIAKWVPGGLFTLGTDGFGRSETREKLREFFEINEYFIVIAVLYKCAEDKIISKDIVAEAIKKYKIDPKKKFPIIL